MGNLIIYFRIVSNPLYFLTKYLLKIITPMYSRGTHGINEVIIF